jgi:4-amino-4-deoxy-L-arabinose transferase-like glycosyltransferase
LHKRRVNRLTALLIVVVLWAGIFLPGLGSTELRGEEPRRTMPAVTMAEGGDWVVPYVGGEPFLRKPPLVQWCIAISLKIFGHSAWAVRLPSVLSILALAATIILATRGWLKTGPALMAAVIMMTQAAIVDKGRLAELEAIYASLSGIAIVLWMSWWVQGRSPWLVWTVPFVVHGLALLAKAPLHLLFFYAIVAGAHLCSGEWSRLWNRKSPVSWRIGLGWLLVVTGIAWWFFKREPSALHWCSLLVFAAGAAALPARSRPHLTGVTLMVLIFAAWAEPYYQCVDPAALAETLKHQAVDRFFGPDSSLKNWLLNIPSGLGDHLPWVLFAPLLWSRRAVNRPEGRDLALFRGGRWGVALCFVALLLIPGVLPRYVLPLTAPFSIFLAQVLWRCPHRLRHWWRATLLFLTGVMACGTIAAPFAVARALTQGAVALHPVVLIIIILPLFMGVIIFVRRCRLYAPLHLTLWTALVAVLGLTLYATAAVPWVRQREKVRPFAATIDSVLPAGSTLVAYNVGDFPPLLGVLFHLQRTPYVYAPTDKEAPSAPSYFLVREDDRKKFENKFQPLESLSTLLGRDEKPVAVLLRAVRSKESFSP